jgi:hypothetical protein
MWWSTMGSSCDSLHVCLRLATVAWCVQAHRSQIGLSSWPLQTCLAATSSAVGVDNLCQRK